MATKNNPDKSKNNRRSTSAAKKRTKSTKPRTKNKKTQANEEQKPKKPSTSKKGSKSTKAYATTKKSRIEISRKTTPKAQRSKTRTPKKINEPNSKSTSLKPIRKIKDDLEYSIKANTEKTIVRTEKNLKRSINESTERTIGKTEENLKRSINAGTERTISEFSKIIDKKNEPDEKTETTSESKTDNPWFKFGKSLANAIGKSFKIVGEFYKTIGDASTTNKLIDVFLAPGVKKWREAKTTTDFSNAQAELLGGSYQLAMSQARKSYLHVTIASYIGFFIVGISIIMVFIGKPADVTITTAITGALVELISALFLNIYSKSLEQFNFSMRQMQTNFDKFVANKLIEDLPKEDRMQKKKDVIDAYLVSPNNVLDEVSPKQDKPSKPESYFNYINQIEHLIPIFSPSAIQVVSIFSIYTVASILSWYEVLPTIFLPATITFIGFGVLLNFTSVSKNEMSDASLNLVLVTNSLFIGYSFWRYLNRQETGVIVFLLALAFHYIWLVFSKLPADKRKVIINRIAIILAFLLLVLIFFLIEPNIQFELIDSTLSENTLGYNPTETSSANGYRTSAQTNCYMLTDEDSDIVARIPEGEIVYLIGVNSQRDWLLIRWHTIECWTKGYVAEKNFPTVITPTLPTATPTIRITVTSTNTPVPTASFTPTPNILPQP